MRAACSFLRQHSRRRGGDITIFGIFQNFFTTSNPDLLHVSQRKRRIAHHPSCKVVQVTMLQFAEKYAVFCRGA
jgi:hypothetical protein